MPRWPEPTVRTDELPVPTEETEQVQWMDALARQGYRCALCHGWQEAAKTICEYLGIQAAL